jgi:putative endonuclease
MATARQRMATGGYGEASAARHLTDQGMVVLDRVLTSQKTRTDPSRSTRSSIAFGAPLEAVTASKVARMRRLAARWMTEHGVYADEVRIDLVGVRLDVTGPGRFDHARGVG